METPVLDRISQTPGIKKKVSDYISHTLKTNDWIETNGWNSLGLDKFSFKYEHYVMLHGIDIIVFNYDRQAAIYYNPQNDVLWMNLIMISEIDPLLILNYLLKDF